MYNKAIKTNTGTYIDINIPECPHDVNMGKAIAIMPYISQLVNAVGDERLVKSPFELLAIITGMSIDDLYTSVMPGNALEAVNSYCEAAVHYIYTLPDSAHKAKCVKVTYNGQVKKINVMKLSMEPVGAYMAANEVIIADMDKCIEQYGPDGWKQNFAPTFEACAQVVDQFLYSLVTGKPWEEDKVKTYGFVNQLSVPDALYIAKYFYNAWPELNKPGTIRRQGLFWHIKSLFSKTIKSPKTVIYHQNTTPKR